MSETFCNLPWNQIYVSTSGNHRICCNNLDNITKDDGYLHYNMTRDKITDSWNSEYMKDMRRKLMRGEKHKNCEIKFILNIAECFSDLVNKPVGK